MIIFRETSLPIQMTNMILLEDADGDLVYVNKDTYDQAFAIFTRFEGDYPAIWRALASKFNKEENKEVYDLIVRWRKTAPEPLGALMFAFTNLKDTKGIEWNTLSKEDMYGFMHEISLMINFDAMSLVPAEIRAVTKIPKTVLLSYKTSWDSILNGLNNKVVLDETPKAKTLLEMSPEDFKEVMESFISKLTNILESRPVTVTTQVIEPKVESSKPVITEKKQILADSPVPKPDSSVHIKKQEEANERELNEDEKKDSAAWDQDWDAIFAEAEKKSKEKMKEQSNQSASTSTSNASTSTTVVKESINGTPIAKFDKDKAEVSKKVLKSFGDDI